jgi:hypothetical protein
MTVIVRSNLTTTNGAACGVKVQVLPEAWLKAGKQTFNLARMTVGVVRRWRAFFESPTKSLGGAALGPDAD